MTLARLNVVFVVFCFITVCSGTVIRVTFEKCDVKGWTCTNSLEISGKHDLTYKCHTNISQEIQLWVWLFSAPGTVTSLTIEDCEKVELSFICSSDNKPIQWLKLKNIGNLEIMSVPLVHNPPMVIFENISNINKIPRETFVQIKKTVYKPGCFIPVNDLNSIVFKDVTVDTIETEAFKNLTDMKKFVMENVKVGRIEYGAIKLSFKSEVNASVTNSDINVLEPMAMQVTGDGLKMLNNHFGDLFSSSINGTIYDFEFINNTVLNIQAGAICVLAKNVFMNNNFFKQIESGAFRKISPGLLHDSNRGFGTLYFIYDFNNNLIEHVEDSGVRPDIGAYRNVATHINYTENTLQCSCEAVSWIGAEVDLGFGYSVLKDFNTMILDPANKNVCNFNPCLCFGIRSPNKKRLSALPVF